MKLKKISKNILILFMILQPLFDLQILYSDKILDIFKFSPSTIVRLLFLLFLGVSAFWMKKDKISKKPLICFIIIYILYSVIHLYNGSIFNIPVSSYDNYSILGELFYLIRMLCPVLLIFITYYNDIKEKDVKKIIITVYLIFSSVMVITNFLGIALTAYPVPDRQTIAFTFFDWFKPGIYEKYDCRYFTSIGLFNYINPISALLVGMLPLLMYIVLSEKFKIINVVTLFLSMLAMAMLGSRIAGFGMFAVVAVSLGIYCFFKIINKEKIKKIFTKSFLCCCLFLFIFIAMYKYMPMSKRGVVKRMFSEISDNHAKEETKPNNTDNKNTNDNNKTEDKLKEVKNKIKELEISNNKEEIRNVKLKFLEENYKTYKLPSYFFNEAYSYKEDPDFWFMMLDEPDMKTGDLRKIKFHITKRVFELNNNKLDYLVGFSFERPMGANIYMENDIIAQFYSLGIFGVILFVFPYLFVTIYAFIKMFKNKAKFNYLNVTYIVAIWLIYFISLLSGNVFDQWIVTLFLGFITGALLRNIKD